MNLTTIPLQDWYETVLTQNWDGNTWTIFVAQVPTFTFPAWETTYIIVDPWTVNAQIAEINAINIANSSLTVNNITLELGNGITSTARSHWPQSKVLISDNFQFWKDIRDSINSKVNADWSGLSTTWDVTLNASGWNLIFQDQSNAPINLTTIANASWADRRVAVSTNDTTPWELNDKLEAWEGLSKTITTPSWNEDLNITLNRGDANAFASSTGTSNSWKAAILDANGTCETLVRTATNAIEGKTRLSTDAEAKAWTIETVALNPKQARDNYAIGTIQSWNDIRTASLENAQSTTSTTFVKVKEATLNFTGWYSANFLFDTPTSWNPLVGTVRVLVNWVEVLNQSYDKTTWQARPSFDFTANESDNIEVFIQRSGSVSTCNLSQFRINTSLNTILRLNSTIILN